jgi:hypothetical protein
MVATRQAIAPSASIHTASGTFAEEKRGFLSRLNPFAKPAEETTAQAKAAEAAKAAQDLNVEIEEEEEEELIPR